MTSREQFIRQTFETAWSRGDTTIVAEEIGDVAFHYGGQTVDIDGQQLAQVIEGWRQGFPDLRFEVEDLLEVTDRMAVRARLRGTHLGAWRGVPPTGRTIDIEVMMFFRWEDGRLVEIWEVDEALRRDRQLGFAE